jgi:hypothetical protein
MIAKLLWHLRRWRRNAVHQTLCGGGAWSIDIKRHVASCWFCGYEDKYKQTRDNAVEAWT